MKIGFKILILLLFLLVTLYFLERIYDFGLRQNQNIKIANVSCSPKNARLLIHGPCEPLWMLSPQLLDPVTGIPSYNLALSHSDFADNYLHFYLYLQHNSAPQYLLLYVTPESLDKRFNTFNTYRFAPYLHDPVVAEVVKENDPAYYKWIKIPFMKYAYYNNRFNFEVIQGYKHFITKRKTAYYDDGFEPPTKRAWGNHAGKFAVLYKENTIFKPDSLREKYLLKTIRLAKQRNILVYLYESPVLHEALAFQPNRERMLGLIDSIAKNEKVPFIKFDLEMAKDRKYFISTLSFNMQGIRLFNDTLARFLKINLGKDSVR
jgi:hypothetical protein